LQFFLSSRLAEGRKRQRRRIHLRWTQPPQSRPRRAFQDSHRQGRSGDRLSHSAGKRPPVSRQRPLTGGLEHQQLSTAWLQKFDGLVRLHRRPASLGFPRRAISQALAQQKRRGSRRPPSRAGETRQTEGAPVKARHFSQTPRFGVRQYSCRFSIVWPSWSLSRSSGGGGRLAWASATPRFSPFPHRSLRLRVIFFLFSPLATCHSPLLFPRESALQ